MKRKKVKSIRKIMLNRILIKIDLILLLIFFFFLLRIITRLQYQFTSLFKMAIRVLLNTLSITISILPTLNSIRVSKLIGNDKLKLENSFSIILLIIIVVPNGLKRLRTNWFCVSDVFQITIMYNKSHTTQVSDYLGKMLDLYFQLLLKTIQI